MTGSGRESQGLAGSACPGDVDPLRNPTPCNGDFDLVCAHYGVSDDERRLMTEALLRDPPAAARTFRAVAREIWEGRLP